MGEGSLLWSWQTKCRARIVSWTAKVNGKTVNRRLTQSEAELYQEWIDNDRRQRAIITKMREIAATATEFLLHENARQEP